MLLDLKKNTDLNFGDKKIKKIAYYTLGFIFSALCLTGIMLGCLIQLSGGSI